MTTHLDGVPWDRAPLPPARHRCRAQSWTKLEYGPGFMVRCSCGAAAHQEYAKTPQWRGKNSRRIDPVNRPPYRRPLWLAIVKKVLS